MVTTAARFITGVVLVASVSACGGRAPTAPTALLPVSTSTFVPPPPTASTMPPLTGPSRTFGFERALGASPFAYTEHSSFILYDNGAFVLRYGLSQRDYPGTYAIDNGELTFQFEGFSDAKPWGAKGTLLGDTLTVRYSLIMALSDFDDAVYVER